MEKYILDGHRVKKCPDLFEWSKWIETADRTVAVDEREGVRVSTVFLGLDHGFGSGKIHLFETMVFGGEHDGYMDRYSTWKSAEKGHARICEFVWFSMKTTLKRKKKG